MESTIKWQTGEINDDGYYLVTNREGRVYVLCHRKGSIFSDSLESVIAWCPLSDIEPYKEETMEEIKIDIPKGYEFSGVDDDNQKVVFTRIQPTDPKTYEECCKVLGCTDDFFTNFGCNGCDVEISDYEDKIDDLLQNFRKLRYCRDAYWKLAGERMGLGKPWEPDFTNDNEERYGIYTTANKVIKDFCGVGDVNVILTFPTEEMRDKFYENFKEFIENCKELL